MVGYTGIYALHKLPAYGVSNGVQVYPPPKAWR
jgi:hypothetical protein